MSDIPLDRSCLAAEMIINEAHERSHADRGRGPTYTQAFVSAIVEVSGEVDALLMKRMATLLREEREKTGQRKK